MQQAIEQAATAIANASAFLFTAGAGMGVDSGLPDFRGNEGFWKAYPPFQKLGLSFVELANPQWFKRDPELAWGFYGHRLNLYRHTTPHAGFDMLRAWGETRTYGVYTSNVDGHFQKAGFQNVCEVHGSISHFQCTVPCSDDIWEAPPEPLDIDEATFRVRSELPRCPHCGEVARPNILMFYDGAWIAKRSELQEEVLFSWLDRTDLSRATIIEMGAGTAVPTVRYFSEHCQKRGTCLIRINPRESQGPSGTISLPFGSREALERIFNVGALGR